MVLMCNAISVMKLINQADTLADPHPRVLCICFQLQIPSCMAQIGVAQHAPDIHDVFFQNIDCDSCSC